MMSKLKTGLMYSPLTSNIYWGRVNTETGVSVGNNQKDVTSDFIGVMLQKFPINTRQNITSNGVNEAVVFVLDNEKAKRFDSANEMFKILCEIHFNLTNDDGDRTINTDVIHEILNKAGK